MDWLDEPKTQSSVTERDFSLVCDSRTVPGVLFTGDAPVGRPIALLGHGGTMDKRAPYLVGVARRLVRHFGISAVSIDGPGHGDRRTQPVTDAKSMTEAFDAAWADPNVTDEIVADWRASLDAISSEVSPGRVGYFGLSMGTMMGLPLCVAEPRIEACVLGLMGYWGLNRERLKEDAPRHSIPTRFLMQWDDQIVPRETALALFGDLGSKDRAMHAHPGLHAAVPPTEMRDVADYLAAHLDA